MLDWIRRALCSHRYDLADLSARDKDGMVSCRCYKCGAVHRADYGLALPGVFDRNSDGAMLAAKAAGIPVRPKPPPSRLVREDVSLPKPTAPMPDLTYACPEHFYDGRCPTCGATAPSSVIPVEAPSHDAARLRAAARRLEAIFNEWPDNDRPAPPTEIFAELREVASRIDGVLGAGKTDSETRNNTEI